MVLLLNGAELKCSQMTSSCGFYRQGAMKTHFNTFKLHMEYQLLVALYHPTVPAVSLTQVTSH